MKLVRRLLLSAAVVAMALWLRQAMTPRRGRQPASVSPFRQPGADRDQVAPSSGAPAPSTAINAASTDDLEAVNGIGPAYSERLARQGIGSFAELVAANTDELASAIDVGRDQVEDWQTQARALI